VTGCPQTIVCSADVKHILVSLWGEKELKRSNLEFFLLFKIFGILLIKSIGCTRAYYVNCFCTVEILIREKLIKIAIFEAI